MWVKKRREQEGKAVFPDFTKDWVPRAEGNSPVQAAVKFWNIHIHCMLYPFVFCTKNSSPVT